MRIRALSLVSYVFVLAIGVAACDDGSVAPTSALHGVSIDHGADEESATSLRFFTGRDSFGVAFKMQTSGDGVLTSGDGRCEPDDTVVLSGSGNGTYLGRVNGTFSHCANPGDPSSFYGGEFSLTGSTGSWIRGTYEPPVDNVVLSGNRTSDEVVIETKAEINDDDVEAVQREELKGKGDLRIVMTPDGSFEQTFDGWLRHHDADE